MESRAVRFTDKLELRRHIVLNELRYILAHPRDIELAAENRETFVDAVAARQTVDGGTLYEDGLPIVAGGLTVLSGNYRVAWLVASKDLKPYLRIVLPEVKRVLRDAKGAIILANVSDSQPAAQRLVLKLGFERGPKYLPASRNYILDRTKS